MLEQSYHAHSTVLAATPQLPQKRSSTSTKWNRCVRFCVMRQRSQECWTAAEAGRLSHYCVTLCPQVHQHLQQVLRAYAFESSKVRFHCARPQQCFGCLPLSHRVLSLQVLELQHRVLQLQRLHCDSAPASEVTEAVRAAENSAQHQCAAIQRDTSHEGTGGPWIIGRKSHPELSGRAVRDVAVQAHAASPPAAVSQPQAHAHVQTDACETSDRACSPLPATAQIKEEDDGRAPRITLPTALALPFTPFATGPNRLAYAFYMKTCLDLGCAPAALCRVPRN